MLRKLAVFIISAGIIMSPVAVHALGFGGIKLKSALSEKLDAEVNLLSATSSDINSLKIKLASESAFLRAGIERTALLNKLQFNVKQRSDGDYYIHVTTREAVREPFVNFLLDMEWKNGRMLREYTMLIDPPGRAPQQVAEPAPVVAETAEPVPEPVAAAEPEPSPFTEPAPEPVSEAAPLAAETVAEPIQDEPAQVASGGLMGPDLSEPAPEPEPIPEPVVEVVEPVPAVEPPPPAPVEEQTNQDAFADNELWPTIPLTSFDEDNGIAQTDDSPSAVASGGEMGDLDYGITRENDNAWTIAEKLRNGDESVSVYQVMMALLQSNPEAFHDNNIHRLKVGHVLRIEDPSMLTSLSRNEAANEYIAQTDAWNSYRQQTADAAGMQPIMAGSDDDVSGSTTVADNQGELTLSSPDGEALTAGGGVSEEALSNDLATIQEQLRQAKQDAGTMRSRNVELNTKLQSLEDELNRLQRSLSVKDDELAALQKQLSDLNQQPAAAPVTEAAPEPAQAEPEPQPAPVEESAEQSATEEAAAEPAAEPEPEPEQAQAQPEPAPAVVEEPAAPPAEESIMDTVMGILAAVAGVFTGLMAGGSLLYIAAPIALVLLILIIILVKRRSQGEKFQESILTGAANMPEDATGDATADSTTFSEESSFLSDFAMSGASAIQADESEVDPLTEADVFMAYGRYEAAEERLNEAIQHEPDRMELRAKLLELFHATQNKDAFEASAEDFYASLGGQEADNPLWQKVVEMGSEIAPANPLFNSGAAGGDDTAAIDTTDGLDDPGMGMTDSQVMDIGLETGVFEAADLSNDSAQADSSSEEMDFNLDLGETSAETAAAEEPAMDFNLDLDSGSSEEAPAEEPAMDFNLDLDAGSTEEKPAEEPSMDMDFNLDMDMGTDTAEAASDAPAETTSDDGALDFNLDMDMGSDTAEAATDTPADDGGLDFNLDIGADSGAADESMDLNLDAADAADADISGGDEVGTKLDLAKAYIDMGDPEGARSILDEVLDEGSDTQKEEAQSLLSQIA